MPERTIESEPHHDEPGPQNFDDVIPPVLRRQGFQIVRPSVELRYRTNDGRSIRLPICFHLGGILQLLKTVKWCYHQGITVAIVYMPEH